MTVPTLQELIEEEDVRHLVCRVIIGGATLPKWTSVNYDFSIGQVPTATIVVPGLNWLPASVVEEASVQIWLGFRVGITVLEKLVFGGAVVDSVGNNGHDIVIDCVMDGPRKLGYSYNRTINYDFTAVTAETAVEDLLELAGVANFAIDLDPWVIGTAVPQTINFSTYGEAINRIAEVDGSPWYAMPTGQVRVERRDPVPAPSARRTYFSNILTGPISTSPTAITNADAKPRINDIQRRSYRGEVANFITVEGAVLTTLGVNGEQNSEQILETVDGASGLFDNGAPWIPTPPLFQHFTFNNELIDTNAKAFAVAERYFHLKNRLMEKLPLSIPADPDVFLGSTVKVVDPRNTGIQELFFVEGYATSIDEGGASTELRLTGGHYAGTTGFAKPFADFIWKYEQFHLLIPGAEWNLPQMDLGPESDLGSKFCMDIPEGTGDTQHGGGRGPGQDYPSVLISFDGTVSQDFDGIISSYQWQDNNGHSGTGPRITIGYNPSLVSSIQMTLTVTDNSGRTDSITKTVYTAADYLDVPGADEDPKIDDTEKGGGAAIGDCTECDPEVDDCDGTGDPGAGAGEEGELIGPGGCNGMAMAYFIAAEDYAMGTKDNRTWNDMTKSKAGVSGDFISVASGAKFKTGEMFALFGTSAGEIVRSTDYCVSGEKVFTVPNGAAINCIQFDTQEGGGTATDPSDPGHADAGVGTGNCSVPIYTAAFPGTMTYEEAYKQCRCVGFDHTTAVIAVAILKAESGLTSNARNTSGNNPPSTDRGIAQINSYYHPEVTDACADNTECAIGEMFRIADGGTDFTPWSVYNGGQYRKYLSAIQEVVGAIEEGAEPVESSSTEGGGGGGVSGGGSESSVLDTGMKIWAGTDDGKIYVSNDSGKNWELWVDFGDGYPINVIGTPGKFFPGDSYSLWAFGGDTSDINTLIRIDSKKNRNFVPLLIEGDLATDIYAGGGGHTITISSTNQTASLIGFSGGVTPRVWTSPDPIGDPTSWIPASDSPSDAYVFPSTGAPNAVAPGFGGDFLVNYDVEGLYFTDNNDDFVFREASTINHLIWLGVEGSYLAVNDTGLLFSMDKGFGFGVLRPNPTLGSPAWPAGAVGRGLALGLGPRGCVDQFDNCADTTAPTNVEGNTASGVSSILTTSDLTEPTVLFWVANYVAGGFPNIPTLVPSDEGTFERVESVTYSNNERRLSLFRLVPGTYDPATITNGVTIEFNQTQTAVAWGYDRIPTTDIETKVVQKNTNSGTGASGTVALQEFENAEDNFTYAVFSTANALTAGSGLTQVGQFGSTIRGMSERKLGQDLEADATFASGAWAGIAVELSSLGNCKYNYVLMAGIRSDGGGTWTPSASGWENVRSISGTQPDININSFVKNPPFTNSDLVIGNKAFKNVSALDSDNVSELTNIGNLRQPFDEMDGFIPANRHHIWVVTYVSSGSPNIPRITSASPTINPSPFPFRQLTTFLFGPTNQYRFTAWMNDQCNIDPSDGDPRINITWDGQNQVHVVGSHDRCYLVGTDFNGDPLYLKVKRQKEFTGTASPLNLDGEASFTWAQAINPWAAFAMYLEEAEGFGIGSPIIETIADTPQATGPTHDFTIPALPSEVGFTHGIETGMRTLFLWVRQSRGAVFPGTPTIGGDLNWENIVEVTLISGGARSRYTLFRADIEDNAGDKSVTLTHVAGGTDPTWKTQTFGGRFIVNGVVQSNAKADTDGQVEFTGWAASSVNNIVLLFDDANNTSVTSAPVGAFTHAEMPFGATPSVWHAAEDTSITSIQLNSASGQIAGIAVELSLL